MRRTIAKTLLASTLLAGQLLAAGCGEFDDSKIWSELERQSSELADHASRIAALERLCNEMNTNIGSMQAILGALREGDFVKEVKPITEGGKEVGYTIVFANRPSIEIRHGEDGADGSVPVVGLKQDTDGLYYWTLGDGWLLDASGKKVPAQGPVGEAGDDGVTPKLKIEDDNWFVSYDGGTTWTKLGRAKGDQGESGQGGDSMFKAVDYTSSTDYVVFTLSNGTQLKLPTWSAFEALRVRCNQLNSDIVALKAIVDALEGGDYVTGVVPVIEGGEEVGYSILFAKGKPVTIFHGKTGAAGSTPIIGVSEYEGTLYWTVNGEWLLKDGEKVRAEGKDGQDGSASGGSGQDGVTPKLRIKSSTNYWEVSYDEGATWESLGIKATGPQGPQGNPGVPGTPGSNANCVFSDVTIGEDMVTFTLADGTSFTLPKGTGSGGSGEGGGGSGSGEGGGEGGGEVDPPIPPGPGTDLSASSSANCYIVSSAGEYKFKAVMGNSSTSVGAVASAEVLWESYGTATAPSTGALVSNLGYSSGYVSFTASSQKGNAVIAAKNSAGGILWSWHIWLTDKPSDQVYNNSAGTMMDRNLGATSAAAGDVAALGLMYQWGRKDPFLGSSSIASSTKAVSTNSSAWTTAGITATTGTIDYALSHPTTYLQKSNGVSNNDWYYTGTSSTDDTRWASSKTIHDPCPPGYRIPDGGENGVWSKAFGTFAELHDNRAFDSTNRVFNFGTSSGGTLRLTSSPTCSYPVAGILNPYDGSLVDVGDYSYYWSCTPKVNYAYYLFLNQFGNVLIEGAYDDRVSGRSVRCLEE